MTYCRSFNLSASLRIFFLAFLSFSAISGLSAQTSKQEWFPYESKTGKWSYVSANDGSVLNGKEFDSVTSFAGRHLATVKIKNNWGVIDTTGKMILPAKYSSASLDFSSQRIVLNKKGSKITGIANLQGKFINPFKYESCELARPFDDFLNGYRVKTWLHLEKKRLYICKAKEQDTIFDLVSQEGIVLLKSSWNPIVPDYVIAPCYYVNDYGIVSEYSLIGYSSRILDPEVVALGENSKGESLFAIAQPKGQIIVDVNGNEQLAGTYFSGIKPVEQLIIPAGSKEAVKTIIANKGRKLGIVDLDMNTVLPFDYDRLTVSENGITGLIDTTEIKYDLQLNKVSESAMYMNEKKQRKDYWNSEGKVIDGFMLTSDGLKHYGVATTAGKRVIEDKWSSVQAETDGELRFVCQKPASYNEDAQVAVYTENAELIFERKSNVVSLPGHNLMIVETAKLIELADLRNGKIISTSQVTPEVASKQNDYRYSSDINYCRFAENILMFKSDGGWIAVDTTGNIVFRSNVKEFDRAEVLRNVNGELGIHYFLRENVSGGIYQFGNSPKQLQGRYIEFRKTDERLYVYSNDSLHVHSLTGEKLYGMPSANGNNTINYVRKYDSDIADSVYAIKKNNWIQLADFNFNLYSPMEFGGFQRSDKGDNIIARKYNDRGEKDKYFLLKLPLQTFEAAKAYDKIEQAGELIIGTVDGISDIHHSSGKILFENCSNVMIYEDFISFNLNGSVHWMNLEGKVYKIGS